MKKLRKKVYNTLNTTVGRLTFALLSGLGYFMLLSGVILQMSRGIMLMLLYLAPVIICGSAIVVVKMLKDAQTRKDHSAVNKIFWLHTAVILLGVVFIIAM